MKRNQQPAWPETLLTQAQRSFRLLSKLEDALSLVSPVCMPKLPIEKSAFEARKRWTEKVPAEEICAYLDGVSQGDGRTSWGYVLKKNRTTIAEGRGANHGGEFFDAEIIGTFRALEKASELSKREQFQLDRKLPKINLFLDSVSNWLN